MHFPNILCFHACILQLEQQLQLQRSEAERTAAEAASAQQELAQLQVVLAAAKEKARSDHLVLAKEVKRLRGELAAAVQVGGCNGVTIV